MFLSCLLYLSLFIFYVKLCLLLYVFKHTLNYKGKKIMLNVMHTVYILP